MTNSQGGDFDARGAIGRPPIWRKWRRILRNTVAARPLIYIPLARAMRPGFALNQSTDLVIEGFPSSGNSFFEASVRCAQTRALSLAHHTHAPATVLMAARRGLATIVLIRDPLDATASAMTRFPGMFDAPLALQEWISFYRAITPVREAITVMPFDAFTSDIAASMRALNARWSLALDEGMTHEALSTAARTMLDDLTRHRGRGPFADYSERLTSAARAQRNAQLQHAKELIMAPAFADARNEAEELYRRFCR